MIWQRNGFTVMRRSSPVKQLYGKDTIKREQKQTELAFCRAGVSKALAKDTDERVQSQIYLHGRGGVSE